MILNDDQNDRKDLKVVKDQVKYKYHYLNKDSVKDIMKKYSVQLHYELCKMV